MDNTQNQSPLQAIGFMLAASALFSGTGLLAKALGKDALGPALHPLQISHGRFLFALFVLLIAALVMRPRFAHANFGIHIARTTCGWGGISLMYAAIAYIPLSDATAISFLNPVFAMMLAIPLLGERVGPVRWAAAAVALVGAVILSRPTAESFQPAALLALSAAMVMGLEITLIKLLSGRERPLQILLINNSIGLVIATIAVLFVWMEPTFKQWMALAGVGLLMALAQSCFIQAMRRVDASFIVPFSYAALVFASLYDYAIFDVIPDTISVTGAGIIITGAVLLAWREAIIRSKNSNVQKIRVVGVDDTLPDELDVLRKEARQEGFGFIERLVVDWESGENRFGQPDESLMIIYEGGAVAGVGGISVDPVIPDALRMRRFYVRERFRRRGLAQSLTKALLEFGEQSGKLITVNAGTPDAPVFWEAMGFKRHDEDGHTHVLPDHNS